MNVIEMTLKKIVMLVGVVGCCLASSARFESHSDIITEAWKECRSPDDCGSNECCVLQPIRYSTPTCRPLREEGELCRPESAPVNTTLSYPDGSQIEITGVQWVICPCQPGLICTRGSGVCSRSEINDNTFNSLNDFI